VRKTIPYGGGTIGSGVNVSVGKSVGGLGVLVGIFVGVNVNVVAQVGVSVALVVGVKVIGVVSLV